jgi:hypothetical protein
MVTTLTAQMSVCSPQYARCADRRDVEGQMSLFTPDTEFLVYMDSRKDEATQQIRGGEGLRHVFENLSTYEATTHFNGQSTICGQGKRRWAYPTALRIM